MKFPSNEKTLQERNFLLKTAEVVIQGLVHGFSNMKKKNSTSPFSVYTTHKVPCVIVAQSYG